MIHRISFGISPDLPWLYCSREGNTFYLTVYDNPAEPALFRWPLDPFAPPAVITPEDEEVIRHSIPIYTLYLLFMTWKEVEEDMEEIRTRPLPKPTLREELRKRLIHFYGGAMDLFGRLVNNTPLAISALILMIVVCVLVIVRKWLWLALFVLLISGLTAAIAFYNLLT